MRLPCLGNFGDRSILLEHYCNRFDRNGVRAASFNWLSLSSSHFLRGKLHQSCILPRRRHRIEDGPIDVAILGQDGKRRPCPGALRSTRAYIQWLVDVLDEEVSCIKDTLGNRAGSAVIVRRAKSDWMRATATTPPATLLLKLVRGPPWVRQIGAPVLTLGEIIAGFDGRWYRMSILASAYGAKGWLGEICMGEAAALWPYMVVLRRFAARYWGPPRDIPTTPPRLPSKNLQLLKKSLTLPYQQMYKRKQRPRFPGLFN